MGFDHRSDIRHLQAEMEASARSCFVESEIEHLSTVIRLIAESAAMPSHEQMSDRDKRYTSDSVFSGVDSFCIVNSAYSVLVGAEKSTLRWHECAYETLESVFQDLYRKLLEEEDFTRQCRIVLDLFRIQIVVAVVSYD
jgi:hypothetical protein